MLVPKSNALEAAVIQEIDVIPVDTLVEAFEFLRGELEISPTRVDLEEVPKEILEELEFSFESRMEDVLEHALESMPEPIDEPDTVEEADKPQPGAAAN